jgi:hypothetical protein
VNRGYIGDLWRQIYVAMSGKRDNLPWIHDVVWIKRSLDGDHHVQRCPSMLCG